MNDQICKIMVNVFIIFVFIVVFYLSEKKANKIEKKIENLEDYVEKCDKCGSIKKLTKCIKCHGYGKIDRSEKFSPCEVELLEIEPEATNSVIACPVCYGDKHIHICVKCEM